MARKSSKERTFEGLGVSPGIGIGVVHFRESSAISVPEYRIAAGKVADERSRFNGAVSRARGQIGRLRAKAGTMPGPAAEELGFLLDAYFHMLKDSRLVRRAERRIIDNRINAEAAVQAELEEISDSFMAMDDPYLAARLDDIRELARRLIRNLAKSPPKPATHVPKGSVIVAEELTPADTAQLNPKRAAGIATQLGGAEGHAAIMARALGLPAVMGAAGLLKSINAGEEIVVDGDRGRIVVNPQAATRAAFEHRIREHQRQKKRLSRLRHQPAVTRDGTNVVLQANVELPAEMTLVSHVGATGIGLLRSEFMFMNRDDIPAEEEQYRILKGLVESMEGRPVTVRTLDVGGEKTAAALMGEFGASASSALGLRGIRLSLSRTDVLESQFQAILRAGAHGKIRILLPMVSSVSEVRQARDILHRAAENLKCRQVAIADPLPPVGTMIEIPGAALSADALAQVSDFFAIGSNDLTMYTLAIDRGDEHVAYLYDPLHPAVLRLIQLSAEAALRARIPVSICGEMAGDPRYTALLLGLGFRELSMISANIPRVKQRIREMDLVAANRRAQIIMDQMDSGRIAMLLDDFNALA
ncbi:MAG: phosphoenolpyruvate--protein phosphotransferase [Magnetovibrio sp.]|nr:phosphoenolpyruvate--protein phosphotransferase [Magnetovibrio sp.]